MIPWLTAELQIKEKKQTNWHEGCFLSNEVVYFFLFKPINMNYLDNS